MNQLESSIYSWTEIAKRDVGKLRKLAERAETLCDSYRKDPELLTSAKRKRSAVVRAAAGVEASRLIGDAHSILFKGSREAAKRLLPSIPEESGAALLMRRNIEQTLALQDHEIATLLRTDPETRLNLISGMTAVERRKLATNPLIDLDQIESDTLRENKPHLHAAIDECRQAQLELIGVCSRVLASGMTAEPIPTEGLIPDEAGQGATDTARRYANLEPDWNPEADPIHQAGVAMMSHLVETSHLASEGGVF